MTVPSPSAPMNLTFVLGSSTGGIGRHVKMLAAGCAGQGLLVHVLGPAGTDRDFAFAAAARFTPVEIASRPRPLRDLRAITRLRRLLRASGTSVVHAHGLRAGALAAAALASSRRSRPALVVTVHNAPPPAGGVTGAVYRVLELLVARRADSVVCVSADLEQRMRATGARRVGHAVVPAPHTAIAPQDVSAETRAATRAGLGAEPDRAVVLAVGRLVAQKGFGLLLDAATGWRDIRPEPLLVIAGEGPLAAGLESRAASLGLEVRFTGHRADVPALLAAADVFVLPSVWEGQSLVLQEALRAGMPVVATRVGGNQGLTGEDAAILVPPGNPGRLAGAVRSVLADPALAARLGKAAADRALALPSEDDAVAAALAVYRAVAPSRRSG